MSKLTRTLEKALLEGGKILKRSINRPKRIRYKGPVNLVTQIDKQVERKIIEIIRRTYPTHSILSEESPPLGTSTCKWIIDPLDGTTNFTHGLPLACISIAYEEKGVIKAGGVWNPFLGEWFWAEKGKGASLNGRRIHVSKTRHLGQSLLVTGFPYDRRGHARQCLKTVEAFLTKTRGIRRLGSAALDMCYVACGRFDGFWESKLHVWDQAAGALIAGEAGARLTDFSGRPMNIYGSQTVATNSRIHHSMIRIIRKCL